MHGCGNDYIYVNAMQQLPSRGAIVTKVLAATVLC